MKWPRRVSGTRTEDRTARFWQRKFAKRFPQYPKGVATTEVSRGPGEFTSFVLAKLNKLPDKCKMMPLISFAKTLCRAWITRCHCQRKEPCTSRFLIFWNYFFRSNSRFSRLKTKSTTPTLTPSSITISLNKYSPSISLLFYSYM